MEYRHKLLFCMALPTAMVAGAGLAVMAGAWWMAQRVHGAEQAQMVAWLDLSRWLIGGLTFLLVC